MRVTFIPLSIREFDILLKNENTFKARGAGVSDINVYIPRHNRGGSLFQMLANLARSAAPFLMRTIMPEGVNFAKNVVRDISSGQNLRRTLKKRGIESLKEVGKKIVRGGARRKLKMRKVSKRKIRQYNDIFTSQ